MLVGLLLLAGCAARPAGPASMTDGDGGRSPVVSSLLIRQGQIARRYTPAGQGREFIAIPEGPGVELAVAAEGHVERVQFLLTGSAPGHDANGTWVVAEGPGDTPVAWFPQAGTSGTLQAVVWYTDGVARRSPEATIIVPMPRELFCPNVTLPNPPPVEAPDWGKSEIRENQNLLLLDWVGKRAFLPLTADPETCKDPTVRSFVESARSQTMPGYRGLGVAIRDFVEGGRLPGVSPQRFWLSRARVMKSGDERAVIAIQLVGRAMGDGSVVNATLEAVRRGGRWSVSPVRGGEGL